MYLVSKKKYLLLIISSLLLGWQITGAQSNNQGLDITGKIEGGQNPLPYAMIILQDISGQYPMDFTQADETGYFEISASGGGYYFLEINYLGYKTAKVDLGKISNDTSLLISLIPALNNLTEITVRDTLPPITYKPDTIVYNAAAFYTGRERKLGDLIKLLPGLDVDDENNLTYRGKPIRTLLVEDKPFFGGNGELALTGLPADAVGRVELLEDYHALGFSLNPGAEKKLALNIKLKEDRKNLYFGDVNAGGGLDNYTGRSNVFNYREGTNLYSVLGANNTNEEQLSIKQSMNLLGGPLGVTGNGFQDVFRTVNLVKPASNVRSGKGELFALGNDIVVAKKIDVQNYLIGIHNKYLRESSTLTRYAGNFATPFTELTVTEDRPSRINLMGQLNGRMNLAGDQLLSWQNRISRSSNEQTANEAYSATLGDRKARTEKQRTTTQFTSVLEYVKKYSAGHSLIVGASADYSQEPEQLSLRSDTAFLLNLTDRADKNSLSQNQSTAWNKYRFFSTYGHWFGPKWYAKTTTEVQREMNTFGLFGAGRVTNQRLLINEQRWDVEVFARLADWKLSGRSRISHVHYIYEAETTINRYYWQPWLQIDRTIRKVGIFRAQFTKELENPQVRQFWQGFRVVNFNTVNVGQRSLAPWQTSKLQLSLGRDDPFTNWSYRLNGEHKWSNTERPFPVIRLNGLERISTYAQLLAPQASTSGSIYLEKAKNTRSLSARVFLNHQRDQVLINDNLVRTSSTATYLSIVNKREVNKSLSVRLDASFGRNRFLTEFSQDLVYNLSGKFNVSGTWNMVNMEMKIQADQFDLTGGQPWVAIGRFSARHRLKDGPWELGIRGYVPISGHEVLRVSQSLALYTEERYQVLEGFVLGEVSYNF